jgi:hypothetical protein
MLGKSNAARRIVAERIDITVRLPGEIIDGG